MDFYFQRQDKDSKDCSVISLNNALGYEAITPEEVVDDIEERIRSVAEYLAMDPEDTDNPALVNIRKSVMNEDTNFRAESVWDAAVKKGALQRKPRPLGPKDMVEGGLIFLGKRKDGALHASAARAGLFLDSLEKEPVPLAPETILKNYEEIFAIYKID